MPACSRQSAPTCAGRCARARTTRIWPHASVRRSGTRKRATSRSRDTCSGPSPCITSEADMSLDVIVECYGVTARLAGGAQHVVTVVAGARVQDLLDAL